MKAILGRWDFVDPLPLLLYPCGGGSLFGNGRARNIKLLCTTCSGSLPEVNVRDAPISTLELSGRSMSYCGAEKHDR